MEATSWSSLVQRTAFQEAEVPTRGRLARPGPLPEVPREGGRERGRGEGDGGCFKSCSLHVVAINQSNIFAHLSLPPPLQASIHYRHSTHCIMDAYITHIHTAPIIIFSPLHVNVYTSTYTSFILALFRSIIYTCMRRRKGTH